MAGKRRPKKMDVAYGSKHSIPVSPIGTRYGTEMTEIFGDNGYLQSILDVEAASAISISKLYPNKLKKKDAERIKNAANIGNVTPESIRYTEEHETHHEMGAVIKELAKQSGKSGAFVHYTMTSADAIETAKALQIKRGLEILIKSVESARDACLSVASEWKDIPCIVRTHGQHAIPATFGLPFAFFGSCLDKNARRLSYDLNKLIEGKMSGAIGTYDVSTDEGMDGFAIEREMMSHLGIKPADATMQTPGRENIAYIISDIAVLGGRIESIMGYIKTLKRTEIQELKEEQDKGVVSSSAMPHKNLYGNPYIEERCVSIARVLRGFSITTMESMYSEDFRDLSASLSDRVAVSEAFVLSDYATRLLENVVERIEPLIENISRNLDLNMGTVTSQRVMSRLITKGVDRHEARRITKEAALKTMTKKISYSDALLNNEKISKIMSKNEVIELCNSRTYIGRSSDIIERIVHNNFGKHRKTEK